MLKIAFLLLLFIPFTLVWGQRTRGKVYADDEVLENVYVRNITQNKSEQTDEEGDFSIAANPGDSLVFSAAFYATQRFKVQSYQLEEVWVVELKEDLNQLDEVKLSGAKVRQIDIDKTSNGILTAFKEDYKANPGKYGVGPKGNIGWIVNKIEGLFTNDKKQKKPQYLSVKDLKSLFEQDNLFTVKLLSEQLKILDQHHDLFLEFCSVKSLKSDLLEEDHHFELLDRLVVYSKEFQNLSEKSEDFK